MNIFGLIGAIGLSFVSGFTPIENNLVKHNAIGVATDGNQVRVDISDELPSAVLTRFYELCDNLTATSYSYEFKAIVHHICWNDNNYSTETYHDSALSNDFFNEVFKEFFMDVLYDDDSLLSFKWVYSSVYFFHTNKLATTPSIPTYSLARYDFLTIGDNLLNGNDTGSYSFYINKFSPLTNGYYTSRVGISQLYYDFTDYGLIFAGNMDYSLFNGEFYELTNNYNAYYLFEGDFANTNMSISTYAHTNYVVRTNRNYLTDFYNKVYVNYESSFVYAPFNVNNNSFNSGYNRGFADGYSAGEDSGYIDGYSDGDSAGYTRGYNTGYATGVSTTEHSFTNLFSSIADVPILIIRNMFNFDFFGVNLLGVVLSLFSVFLLLWIFRKLLK